MFIDDKFENISLISNSHIEHSKQIVGIKSLILEFNNEKDDCNRIGSGAVPRFDGRMQKQRKQKYQRTHDPTHYRTHYGTYYHAYNRTHYHAHYRADNGYYHDARYR